MSAPASKSSPTFRHGVGHSAGIFPLPGAEFKCGSHSVMGQKDAELLATCLIAYLGKLYTAFVECEKGPPKYPVSRETAGITHYIELEGIRN